MTDVVVTAIFRPAPDAKESLIAALRAGIPAVHTERGCLLYAIHDAEDGSIVMIEKWGSQAELRAHATGPAVEKLNLLIAPFLDGPVVVTEMAPLPAGTDLQGTL